MAYLNWTQKTGLEVTIQAEVITLAVNHERLAELIENLRTENQYELRLDLPKGWTVYWKVREGDSRLLLSHPEKDQWVGAVSLNQGHYDQWVNLLENWKDAGQATPENLRLSELKKAGNFSKISNLDVVLIPLK